MPETQSSTHGCLHVAAVQFECCRWGRVLSSTTRWRTKTVNSRSRHFHRVYLFIIIFCSSCFIDATQMDVMIYWGGNVSCLVSFFHAWPRQHHEILPSPPPLSPPPLSLSVHSSSSLSQCRQWRGAERLSSSTEASSPQQTTSSSSHSDLENHV